MVLLVDMVSGGACESKRGAINLCCTEASAGLIFLYSKRGKLLILGYINYKNTPSHMMR